MSDKPCPFCGVPATAMTHEDSCYFTHLSLGISRARTKEAWNRRHVPLNIDTESLPPLCKPTAWYWVSHGWTITAHSKHRSQDASVSISPPAVSTLASPDFISVSKLFTEEQTLWYAKLAIEHYRQGVEDDTRRLDFISKNEVSIYTLTSRQRVPLTDGTCGYREDTIVEGWVLGVATEPLPTPRACIDYAMKKYS